MKAAIKLQSNLKYTYMEFDPETCAPGLVMVNLTSFEAEKLKAERKRKLTK